MTHALDSSAPDPAAFFNENVLPHHSLPLAPVGNVQASVVATVTHRPKEVRGRGTLGVTAKTRRSFQHALRDFTDMKAMLVREQPEPPAAPFSTAPNGQKVEIPPSKLYKRFGKSTLEVEEEVEAPYALYFRVHAPEHFKRVERIASMLHDELIGPKIYAPLELSHLEDDSLMPELLKAKPQLQEAQRCLQQLAYPDNDPGHQAFYLNRLQDLGAQQCPGLDRVADFFSFEERSEALNQIEVMLDRITAQEVEQRRKRQRTQWGDMDEQGMQATLPVIKVQQCPPGIYHLNGSPVNSYREFLLQYNKKSLQEAFNEPRQDIVKLYIRPQLAAHIVEQLAQPGTEAQRNQRFVKASRKDTPPPARRAASWASVYERRLSGSLER
jgi:hypothetical protein